MKHCIKEIREKTSGMSRREACSYVLTYYWYHLLGAAAAAALIVVFAAHYGFGNQKPLFTCILVNQETDGTRDSAIRDAFAEKSGIPKEWIEIDSDYQFSFDQFRMQGVNESSYEKFFFRWRNEEIDAVILSESFFRHCKEMGGSFYTLGEDGMEGLELYMDEGQARAVVLGYDRFTEQVTGQKDEKLLLAFPVSGKRTEESRKFLEFVCDEVGS